MYKKSDIGIINWALNNMTMPRSWLCPGGLVIAHIYAMCKQYHGKLVNLVLNHTKQYRSFPHNSALSLTLAKLFYIGENDSQKG